MTLTQKIIRPKLGVLELAKQPGQHGADALAQQCRREVRTARHAALQQVFEALRQCHRSPPLIALSAAAVCSPPKGPSPSRYPAAARRKIPPVNRITSTSPSRPKYTR